MSIAEKLLKIAQNEPKVYEAGKVSAIQGIEPAAVDGSLFGGKLKTIAENTIKVFEAGRAAANFLKATASGKTVRVDDVADIAHRLGVALSSDTVTDFSGVTVSRYGKNLIFNGGEATSLINGVTFDRLSNGQIKLSGSVSGTAGATFFVWGNTSNLLKIKVDTDMVLSGCPYGGSAKTYRLMARIVKADGSYSYPQDMGNGIVIPSGSTIDYIYINVVKDYSITDEIIFKPQLELGASVTDYEPYIEPQTATAEADGTVKGLTSLSPTMTLLTDNEDVTINLEYYKA